MGLLCGWAYKIIFLKKACKPAFLILKPPINRRFQHIGAGDGNRTHTTSLEGWDTTIVRHPRIQLTDNS